MHRTVVLVSPLLPARAYAPLAHALGRRGWGAVIAAVPQALDGPDPVLAAYRDAVASHHADLVVAHSNAGRYAVAAAGAVGARSGAEPSGTVETGRRGHLRILRDR